MNKQRVIICTVSAILILIMVAVGVFATRQSSDTPERLLSLGEKYLTELNYEQALVQYLKVIEIDPMNPRGYTGAAEAYIGLGRTEDAIAILQQGIDRTGDNGIRNMLDTITLVDEPDQSSPNEINQSEDRDAGTDDAVDTDLSSIEPFGFEDVSVLGYPWGVNAYDLQDRGLLENVEISEESGYLVYHPDINIASDSYLRNPNIGFRKDGLISWISIEDGDTTIGPRGSKIGMSMDEIMRLFRCDNPEALEFAKSPMPEVSESVKPYAYWMDEIYYGSEIYFTGEVFQLKYQILNYHEQDKRSCSLVFNIHNKTVSSILIFYSYLDEID